MRKKGIQMLVLLLILSMVPSLAACGGGDGGTADSAGVTETHDVPDDLSPSQEGTDSSNTDPEERPSVKGPKILRSVEYYVGNGTDYLSSYSEYTYDEQGNRTECDEYQRKNDEWVHFRHTEFTYDGQGRVHEQRCHTFSALGDIDDIMTQIESTPDHVTLNFGSSGSQEVYYYNDLGQCVREELKSGSKFQDVTLDAQGVVTGGGTDWYPINCHGQQPSSVTQNADGSIVLTYSALERYTIYPVGVIPEMYTNYLGSELDRSAVHLEYFLTDGGVMNILYHADPASLGTLMP